MEKKDSITLVNEYRERMNNCEDRENKEKVLCEILDTSAIDVTEPNMKAFLKEFKDILLDIKRNARESIDNGKPLIHTD